MGSSIVMLLWILVYSFFPSFDFYLEVELLYGGVLFWVTIVLTVAVALRELDLIYFFEICLTDVSSSPSIPCQGYLNFILSSG